MDRQNARRKTRICEICGRSYTPGSNNQKYCKDCRKVADRRYKRAEYIRNRKVPDGIRRASDGRLYEHKGHSKRIYWTGQMLSDLRRWFATTRNEELAGILGVSQRTVVRKARELGLEKDAEWIRGVWKEHARIAIAKNRRYGNSGMFPKGMAPNEYSFKKGHKHSEESRRKQGESIRRWAETHHGEVMARALRAWETRRRKAMENPTP